MKKNLAPLGAALVLAFLVTGCETNGRTARIQEKSAVYATLTPNQKKVIDDGAIERGYTADMVYMALGTPKTVKSKDAPEGKIEMWTYTNYYRVVAASSVSLSVNNPNPTNPRYTMNTPVPTSAPGVLTPAPPSLFATTDSPTYSLDVADSPAHTVYVLLFNGKVFDIKIGTEN